MQVRWVHPETRQSFDWPAHLLLLSQHSTALDVALLQLLPSSGSSPASAADGAGAGAGQCREWAAAGLQAAGWQAQGATPDQRATVHQQSSAHVRDCSKITLTGSSGRAQGFEVTNHQQESTARQSTSNTSVGVAVMAVGHALLPPRLALLPSVTFGCVSAVKSIPCEGAGAPRHSVPGLLLTDARILSGGSGGGLFACKPAGHVPELLGLVTSNARLFRGRTVPTIGYVLPVAQLAPVAARCLDLLTRGAPAAVMCAELASMDRKLPELDRLWGSSVGVAAACPTRSRL